MYMRGTFNSWGTTAMTSTGDTTWTGTATVAGAVEEQFKFDAKGDWSVNWGDNNGDGYAELSGEDIPFTEGAGEYTVTFNHDTLAYTVTKQGGGVPPGVPSGLSAQAVSGTSIRVSWAPVSGATSYTYVLLSGKRIKHIRNVRPFSCCFSHHNTGNYPHSRALHGRSGQCAVYPR